MLISNLDSKIDIFDNGRNKSKQLISPKIDDNISLANAVFLLSIILTPNSSRKSNKKFISIKTSIYTFIVSPILL